MDQNRSILYLTILLTMIAGYCDAVTFISASEIFSAHVTGNFILFAYNLVTHADANSWLKLLSFPVFIIGVIAGGAVASRFTKAQTMLWVEGAILLLSGITCMVLAARAIPVPLGMSYLLAMCVVFSMGLQNAFGKLFPKETYGPTTMMTGNVTQAALDIGKLVKNKAGDPSSRISLSHQAITIIGFLAGCIFGGLAGGTIGLSALAIPGAALIIYAITVV